MRSVILLVIGAVLGAVGMGLVQGGWIVPPYPDTGHRLFGVKNEAAAAAMLAALESSGGPKAHSAFDAGPTHQVVLNDGQRTVIGWFDESVQHMPPNGISIAVENPRESAESARGQFRLRGFSAKTTRIEAGGAELYLVESDALLGNVLVYRKPWYELAMPPARSMPKGEIKGDL